MAVRPLTQKRIIPVERGPDRGQQDARSFLSRGCGGLPTVAIVVEGASATPKHNDIAVGIVLGFAARTVMKNEAAKMR